MKQILNALHNYYLLPFDVTWYYKFTFEVNVFVEVESIKLNKNL